MMQKSRPAGRLFHLLVVGDGAQERNRTADLMLTMHVLYRLSYLGPWLQTRPLSADRGRIAIINHAAGGPINASP